jgi:mRNA interferase MazF
VKRGELYLVRKTGAQAPRKQRVFAVVSRQVLIDSRFSTVICAPVYSRHDGLSTQIRAGISEGLKRESRIHCDELVSLPKTALTHYVGSLSNSVLKPMDHALVVALGIEELAPEPLF